MKTQYKHLLQRTYLVLVFGFMYLPIAVLIAYSFNENKSRAVFTGFSLKSYACLLYTSPSKRDKRQSRMPSSA